MRFKGSNVNQGGPPLKTRPLLSKEPRPPLCTVKLSVVHFDVEFTVCRFRIAEGQKHLITPSKTWEEKDIFPGTQIEEPWQRQGL
jgi:hypothetical protein